MNARAFSGQLPGFGVWLLLMLLTVISFTLGGTALDPQRLALLVLAIALLKAQLLADHFMGLGRVAGLWRPLIVVYLLILGVGIGLAFISA